MTGKCGRIRELHWTCGVSKTTTSSHSENCSWRPAGYQVKTIALDACVIRVIRDVRDVREQ